MKIHTTVAGIRDALRSDRAADGPKRIVFVPTMGNLHDGHIRRGLDFRQSPAVPAG